MQACEYSTSARAPEGGREPSLTGTTSRSPQAITLFRYFPEAIRVLDTYPSVADVEAAFTAAGFVTVGLEQVPQVTAASLREAATTLRREAHTPLQLISDDEYAAGLARLRRAAQRETGPVVDALDLLVLTRTATRS